MARYSLLKFSKSCTPVVWIVMAFYGFLVTKCSIAATVEVNNNTEVEISRKHLAVWFDYSVRYYDHEADNAYSKDDLNVMVKVVSKRFSKIAIDVAPLLDKLPPENDAHSRVWIPEVVAEHNKIINATTLPKPTAMEVIVSFDVAKIARTKEVTSFDVAKFMADKANKIYPGTVKTLMMYSGFNIFSSYYNVKDIAQQLIVAREKIHGNSSSSSSTNFSYNLAVFLDLKDCGHFKGSLGSKAKELLPHVEIVITLLRPNYHQMSFTPDILHKMFITKFEDCEKKLKLEKPEVRVMPSVLWMARKGSVSAMVLCWQMMSAWAKKNNKEVIMYEAFDTPHGHLLSDQGWFRLRDRSEHDIKEESFIEKIQEKGSKQQISSNNLFPSSWEDSDEMNGSIAPHKSVGSANVAQDETTLSYSLSKESAKSTDDNHKNNNEALYIVLVLLSVICTLLVAVIVGLVYGFRSMVLLPSRDSIPRNANTFNGVVGGNDNVTARRLLTTRNRHCNNQHGRSAIQLQQPHHHQINLQCGEEDVADECRGNFNGSVLEIRDTTPIVSVTYKK